MSERNGARHGGPETEGSQKNRSRTDGSRTDGSGGEALPVLPAGADETNPTADASVLFGGAGDEHALDGTGDGPAGDRLNGAAETFGGAERLGGAQDPDEAGESALLALSEEDDAFAFPEIDDGQSPPLIREGRPHLLGSEDGVPRVGGGDLDSPDGLADDEGGDPPGDGSTDGAVDGHGGDEPGGDGGEAAGDSGPGGTGAGTEPEAGTEADADGPDPVEFPHPADLWRHPLTDLGNARRLNDLAGHDLRYVADQRAWLRFGPAGWRPATDEDVQREVRAMVDLMAADCAAAELALQQRAEQLALPQRAEGQGDRGSRRPADEARRQAGEERRDALARLRPRAAWTRRSQARARLEAVPALLRAEPGVAVRADALDADPWLLGAANGTVDLRTGRAAPPRRSQLVTRASPAPFDPAAACPRWEHTLARLLPDPDVRRFFWKASGYALAGDCREQVLLLLVGRGGNGKSTVLETLRHVLGGYAAETPVETLIARSGSRPSNDLARLQGTRLVTARESEAGGRLSEGLIKHLTGGDRVAARFLYREFTEYEPTFTLMLATNHEPQIGGTDEGIWRRVRLVRFGVTLAAGEADRGLRGALRAEAPGILAWCVRGCLAWQSEGLAAPASVLADTASYRAGQDVLGAFLADCCVTRQGAVPAANSSTGPLTGLPGGLDRSPNGELSAPASALYAAYAAWARRGNEEVMTMTRFGRELTARGFAAVRVGGRVERTGLALRDRPDRPP